MERNFDAGVALVPAMNGNVSEHNMDEDVNARARRGMSPAGVPIGREEPPVARAETDEGEEPGVIVPPQSDRWLSDISWAIPSAERVRSFVLTPEMAIFLMGLVSLISLIVFILDMVILNIFRPLSVAVCVSAGGYCYLLIRRPRFPTVADQAVLLEITEARAVGTSTRVITREERRSLFHYFTLHPPTPLENASSCENDTSRASTSSGASTPHDHGDERGAEGFSPKDLDHSSSDSEESGQAQGGHPMNAIVPPLDGPLGGGEGSVSTRGETRAMEGKTQRNGRRSGSALGKVFDRPRPHGIDVLESMEASASGQQHLLTAAIGEIVDGSPRQEEDISAGACSTDDDNAGCLRGGQECSAPEEKEKDEKKEETLKRASFQWGTGKQCVVCYGEYCYGEDLCQLPCCHIYHTACIDDWLDGANHNWCPVCKKSVLLRDDHDQETKESGGGIGGQAV